MHHEKNNTVRSKSRLALGIVLGLIAISAPASAGSQQGIPSQVEYAGTFLYVQITGSGINYAAQPSSPGCGIAANSVDTMKVWTSLAQAALLSGKQIKIYFTPCGAGSYINDIVLIR